MWVLFVPLALAADTSGEPVKEVLLLLQRIQASIEKEGAEEAAAYDKFACFCKEEADGKQYAIEKALAQEEKLDAQQEADTAEREVLNANVETLAEEISELDADILYADRKRRNQNWRYENRTEQVETGIKAIERAISLTKPEAKGPALVQARALRGKQEPAYEYKEQSAEVVKAFEDLRGQFKDEKTELDVKEASQLHAHELLEQARQTQLEAKEASKTEKSSTSSALSQAIGEDGQDESEVRTARAADQAFLKDLTAKCEAKAQAWDQRSQVRSGELQALAKAEEALSPAVKTYGATDATGRKLGVSLGQLPHHRHGTVEEHKRHVARLHRHKKHRHAAHEQRHESKSLQVARRALAPFFLQLDAAKDSQLRDRLARVLDSDAAAGVRAAVRNGDAFADVKQMLTDLIADLEQEAIDAQAEAAWCEQEMTRATQSRDRTKYRLERWAALTDTKSNLRDELTEDISGLSFEVANLTKALNEETELRAENTKFNQQRVTDATAGLEAVRDAIDILETYYQSVGSPVDPAPLVPEDATAAAAVDSLAPDTGFSNDGYAGNQNSGSFVIAELEKIETTFDTTVTDVTAEEAQEVADYDQLKTDMNADIDAKSALVTQKEGEKTSAKSAIEDAAEDTADGNALLKQTLTEIENLKPACTATLSGADARTAARNQEIAALNQAMGILDTGLSFGNQTDF